MEWVQSGAYDRIRDGDYPRRGQEPPPTEEFEDAVAHYKERFSRILERAAGGVQDLGRRLGTWLERWQTSSPGDAEAEAEAEAEQTPRTPTKTSSETPTDPSTPAPPHPASIPELEFTQP